MEVINPATGARLALIAEHTDAELVAAAAACRRAQHAWAATEARPKKPNNSHSLTRGYFIHRVFLLLLARTISSRIFGDML
jgi:hypothetical protein